MSQEEINELRKKLDEIKAAAQAMYDKLGCGDNSCGFKKPKGMATNGGCRCCLDSVYERRLLRELLKAAGTM